MNIGIFTDCYLPEVNGVVTSLLLFVEEFIRTGHTVFIFAPNDSLRSRYRPHMQVWQFPSVPVFRKQFRWSFPLLVPKEFYKLNLDVIHTYTPGPIGMMGVRLAKKLKIPAVHTYHTSIENYVHYLHIPRAVGQRVVLPLLAPFFNSHDSVIVPSLGMRARLEDYVHRPVVVIPTGTPEIKNILERKNSIHGNVALDRFGVPTNRPLIITTCRLGKEKNVPFLISALRQIRQAVPGATLLIAGTGPERESLEALAEAEGLKNHVIFLGFMTHDDLYSLYKRCRAFVFSSLTETQGLVVLESLSVGLPVVAVRATGVEDLLAGDRGGFLVEPNGETFARHVANLLTDDALYHQKSAEALVRSKDFSIEKMAILSIATYEACITDRKKSAKKAR